MIDRLRDNNLKKIIMHIDISQAYDSVIHEKLFEILDRKSRALVDETTETVVATIQAVYRM